MTPTEVLALPMQQPNDANAATVRDYLLALLTTLWNETEEFSGKRPFGNSGWEWDMYVPLIRAGAVRGALDEDGYVEDVDAIAGGRVIAEAILALGVQP